MSEIGIIANPHSKMNKRNPKRSAMLAYILGEQGSLENTESLEHLRLVARSFYQKKIKILAINGGDGTLSQTLTAFIKEYGETPLPQICVLRGGTINVVAENLGIRGKPEQVLYRLLRAYSIGQQLQIVKIPSICINDHYGFIYADGLATRFLDAFYQNKTGSIGSMILAAKIYFGGFFNSNTFKKIVYTQPVEIQCEDKKINSQSLLNMCTTIQSLPAGLVNYKIFSKNDYSGKLRGVTFEVEPEKIWWKLPAAFFVKENGIPLYSKGFGGESITINGITNYTLDGELFDNMSSQLSINRGPMVDFIKI